jgi:hypothetical protein
MELTDHLYIEFDLSTQQLKALVATSELKVQVAKFDFDTDSCGFAIKNGVITNEVEHEAYICSCSAIRTEVSLASKCGMPSTANLARITLPIPGQILTGRLKHPFHGTEDGI